VTCLPVNQTNAGTSAGFWLGGSMPPCRLRRRKFWKFDYEMVHFEVYLNKYVVSIAPFSTSACPDCSQNIYINIEICSFFACFRFLIFHLFFQRGVSWPHLPLCADAHGQRLVYPDTDHEALFTADEINWTGVLNACFPMYGGVHSARTAGCSSSITIQCEQCTGLHICTSTELQFSLCAVNKT